MRFSTGPELGAACALLLLLGVGCSAEGPAGRIVLVSIDTLRADRVGCYGDSEARTPHLDAIAASGVRFDAAFSPAPLTLPSHASLLTALDPPRHGVRNNTFFALAEDIPTLATRLRDSGYATAAFVGAFVLDARFGLARGFDVYDDEVDQRQASDSQFSFAERTADVVVDAALAWLESAPERFFLWVHLYDPHADYRPPERFLEGRDADPYAGEIAFADEQVGRLVSALERAFGSDVVVAVTSDHGEGLGDHREDSHSYGIYDTTQRVPLLLRAPGLPKGAVVEAPVRLIDVAPTLLELAGAEALGEVDGRSLLPMLSGGPEPARVAYLETLATQLDMGWSPLLGLRTAGHKYVRAPRPELYDVVADPGESRNLAAQESELVTELDALLEARLAGARPVKTNRELSAGDRERLESLGYVVQAPEAAERPLGVVAGPDPKDHYADVLRMRDAGTLLEAGRPEEALALFAQIPGQGPLLLRKRATAALNAGRPELALAYVQTLLSRSPDAFAGDRNLLGFAHLEMGRLEESRREFERALEMNPDAAGALRGLARVAEAEGDLARAEELYRDADRRATAPDYARVDLASLLLGQGRSDEADLLLAGLPAEFLGKPLVALHVTQAQLGAGRSDAALKFLAPALKAHPKNPLLLRSQGNALAAAGRGEAALRAFRSVHSLDPEDPMSQNDFAWGLALVGRNLDRALTLAKQASATLDGSPAVLDTLATLHLLRGESEEALAVADRALSTDPAAELRPHLHFVRAAALDELGRPSEARVALRAAGNDLDPPWRKQAAALSARLGVLGNPARGS